MDRHKHMICHIEDLIACLKFNYGDSYYFSMLFDLSSSCERRREIGLDSKNVTFHEGKQIIMRNLRCISYIAILNRLMIQQWMVWSMVGMRLLFFYGTEMDL